MGVRHENLRRRVVHNVLGGLGAGVWNLSRREWVSRSHPWPRPRPRPYDMGGFSKSPEGHEAKHDRRDECYPTLNAIFHQT